MRWFFLVLALTVPLGGHARVVEGRVRVDGKPVSKLKMASVPREVSLEVTRQ